MYNCSMDGYPSDTIDAADEYQAAELYVKKSIREHGSDKVRDGAVVDVCRVYDDGDHDDLGKVGVDVEVMVSARARR